MEEEGLSPAFAAVLEDRRERYNAAFTAARHRRPALKGPAFLEHLRLRVDPIVAAMPLEGRAPACDALYDLSLELVGCDLFNRYPAVSEGWRRLLPHVAPLLAANPRRLAASLTNALSNLSEQGARATWWLERMLTLRVGDVDTLLSVGQVLAWRAGLPHYRAGALDLCARLDPALTGVGGDLDALRADPWLTPDNPDPGARPRVVFRVGGFRGFGGPFIAPPEVRYAGDNRFFVGDGECWWLLIADGYGTSLHRLAQEPAGLCSEGPDARAVRELRDISSEASGTRSLAVARRLSHYVWVCAV